MKNVICALPILFLFASCQKQIPKQIDGYFYTNDLQQNEATLKLYFDGKEEGVIPSNTQQIMDLKVIDSTF